MDLPAWFSTWDCLVKAVLIFSTSSRCQQGDSDHLLSPRERKIMIEVARGRLCEQIAGDIGIAEATVKVHRSRLMHKMKARSLPELGRMVDKLKLIPEEGQRS